MKLSSDFYRQDVLRIAPLLIGKLLCRKTPQGDIFKYRITETEAYRGEEDSACHARAGKTIRTEIMYRSGGVAYIYLIYGIHYLLNIVTGREDEPQAVLIRGVEGYEGPGKLTKAMQIDKTLNGTNLTGQDIWIEDDGISADFTASKRIGIEYAKEEDRNLKWRWTIKETKKSVPNSPAGL